MAVAMALASGTTKGSPKHRIPPWSCYCCRVGRLRRETCRLNRNAYMTVSATLILIMAIAHLLRIILGSQVAIGGLSIPFWASWLAVLVASALAYFGFMQKR